MSVPKSQFIPPPASMTSSWLITPTMTLCPIRSNSEVWALGLQCVFFGGTRFNPQTRLGLLQGLQGACASGGLWGVSFFSVAAALPLGCGWRTVRRGAQQTRQCPSCPLHPLWRSRSPFCRSPPGPLKGFLCPHRQQPRSGLRRSTSQREQELVNVHLSLLLPQRDFFKDLLS